MVVACPSDVKGVAGAPVGEQVKGVMLKNVASSRAECTQHGGAGQQCRSVLQQCTIQYFLVQFTMLLYALGSQPDGNVQE